MGILVATRGCEVYEFFARGHTQIIQSHNEGQVWGLACNPRHESVFVTAGDDQTLRVWDMEQKQLSKKLNTESAMRAVAYSADGAQLCVGFGGAVKAGKKEGAFMALQGDTQLTLIHEGRPAKKAITDVAFAPNGRALALASADTNLYLHDCKDFDKQAVCGDHEEAVTHVDFSEDSKYVQTNCAKHELLFYDTAGGRQITTPSKLKDTSWTTQHCVYGWQVQGLWKNVPGLPPAPAINAVDKSDDGRLVVSADSLGRVVLRRFPCAEQEHGYSVGLGHSGPVGNVRFSRDGKRVISVGSVDRAIFQWRL